MYYGCIAGACGNLKCKLDWGNCDGVLSNGCETGLVTSDNCGGCGLECGANEKCRIDPQAEMFGYAKPMCLCPAGMTFCGSCQGTAVEGSASICPPTRSTAARAESLARRRRTSARRARASAGSGCASSHCYDGFADCNGDLKDYCETNTKSDPMNCGACGRVCDAIAGQACVNGECVVEPCKDETPDGGVVVPK